MARPKAAPQGANRPKGSGSPESRSGQGAGSALRELLRRQAQNPRPGAVQAAPAGREQRQPPAQLNERKRRG